MLFATAAGVFLSNHSLLEFALGLCPARLLSGTACKRSRSTVWQGQS